MVDLTTELATRAKQLGWCCSKKLTDFMVDIVEQEGEGTAIYEGMRFYMTGEGPILLIMVFQPRAATP